MLTTNVLKENGKTLDYRNCQYRDLCGKRNDDDDDDESKCLEIFELDPPLISEIRLTCH